MSIREAGVSVGAVGFGAVLVESWAKRLTEPSPTTPAANRIRPSEDKGRECMRLSSATTGKSFKKLKVIQTKLTSQNWTWLDSTSLSCHPIQNLGCKTDAKQPHPVIYSIFIITTTLIFNILTTAARRE
jgi:hypothetical protein